METVVIQEQRISLSYVNDEKMKRGGETREREGKEKEGQSTVPPLPLEEQEPDPSSNSYNTPFPVVDIVHA